MFKNFLITVCVLLWIAIGLFAPLDLILKDQDVKMSNIPELVCGAVCGPISLIAWIIVEWPDWFKNNDTILIHKAKNNN